MSERRIVVATRSPHKLAELRALLYLRRTALVDLDELSVREDVEESGSTFEENALIKARFFAGVTRLPTLADDSGLEVDALGGQPGVRSARYAGVGASDEDNNRKLVAEMRRTPEDQRSCRYRCVAILVDPRGSEIVAEGSCEGTVILEGRGTMGFGYDPHVIPAGETRTMAEIPLDEKLRFSHRGRAFRLLAERIRASEA